MAPSRLWPILTSGVLSARGKLRLSLERFVPPRAGEPDESLASFVLRRVGREAYERLVQPLISSIYSGDPESMSLSATLPRFKEMETNHGSLWRAMRREEREGPRFESSGARYGQFVAPRGGLLRLVEGAARRLSPSSIRLHAPVETVCPLERGGWRVHVRGDHPRTLTVDGLVLAAPAFEAARLLWRHAPTASQALREIPYASCAVVALGYRCQQIGHPLDGFGFVVPRVEDRLILSCSFASRKYPGRAPDGSVLLRVFIGGALQAHLLRLSDDDLVELARLEVGELLDVRGEPLFTNVSRHHRALPQYRVGHIATIERIEADLQRFSTLALTGSAYRGVGIPHCVHSGEEAADRILQGVRHLCRLATAVH
jgi:oxygen-dependent protoporphyrinogen oxidase